MYLILANLQLFFVQWKINKNPHQYRVRFISQDRILSPITQKPCLLYETIIYGKKPNQNEKFWQKIQSFLAEIFNIPHPYCIYHKKEKSSFEIGFQHQNLNCAILEKWRLLIDPQINTSIIHNQMDVMKIGHFSIKSQDLIDNHRFSEYQYYETLIEADQDYLLLGRITSKNTIQSSLNLIAGWNTLWIASKNANLYKKYLYLPYLFGISLIILAIEIAVIF